MSMPASAAPSLPDDLSAWLDREVGPVVPVRRLIGGITGEIVQVRRADGGDLVVRSWAGDDPEQPLLVRREQAGLAALADTGLPVPRILAADAEGVEAGRPTTVTSFLPGRVELAPPDLRTWVRRLAATLVRIHAVPPPPLALCGRWTSTSSDALAVTLDTGAGRAVRELADDARARADVELVTSHGDYQHFNVLWDDGGDVSAIVDWPTAGLAERGLDVGHCRLNLAALFSADAAMDFLDDDEELAGVRVDPAADVERLLQVDGSWPRFLPRQVAGRAPVDGPGMIDRVRETLVRTLRRTG